MAKIENPWEERLDVTLPRAPKNEENFIFVAVNGRTFQVPRNGRPVSVPRPVYEVLMNAAAAADYAADRKGVLSEE